MTKNRTFLMVAIGLMAILTIRFVDASDTSKQESDPTKSRLILSQPLAVNANADTLSRLRIERRNVSVKALQATSQLYLHGRGKLDSVIASAKRALRSQLDTPGANKLQILEEHAELARMMEKITVERHSQGVVDAAELANAQHWRLDMDVRLAREVEGSKK